MKNLEEVMWEWARKQADEITDVAIVEKEVKSLSQAILKHLREVADEMKVEITAMTSGIGIGYNQALSDFLERIEKL